MTVSALLDTSFFITLLDQSRPNHEVANKYYKTMLTDSISMYLSTIVASEFGLVQPVEELPLRNLRIVPFNFPHAKEVSRIEPKLPPRADGASRVEAKDDVKIIAQASKEHITFILTDDGKTLFKYCDRLRSQNEIAVRAIKLSDGFDPASLRLDGQRDAVEDFS